MALIAKPIVKNQLWIVTDGINKVGNVESTPTGFNLKLGNLEKNFSSTKDIQKLIAVEFQRPGGLQLKPPAYAKWPTCGKTFNNLFDLKRKLHVYTKTKKSKCYHAAGWFRIQMGEGWVTLFCPKYIFVQRYPYQGPFATMEEAVLNK